MECELQKKLLNLAPGTAGPCDMWGTGSYLDLWYQKPNLKVTPNLFHLHCSLTDHLQTKIIVRPITLGLTARELRSMCLWAPSAVSTLEPKLLQGPRGTGRKGGAGEARIRIRKATKTAQRHNSPETRLLSGLVTQRLQVLNRFLLKEKTASSRTPQHQLA
jgi:hypothetical protein